MNNLKEKFERTLNISRKMKYFVYNLISHTFHFSSNVLLYERFII